jgi:hypothetical protein
MYKFILLFLNALILLNASGVERKEMIGELRDRTLFENPYANIPPQCYTETSYGMQNSCLFCHSNAAARIELGNTIPQAGLNDKIGNLQLEYAFGPANEFTKNPNVNPWRNLIAPKELSNAFKKLNIDTKNWNLKEYIKTDNWEKAYNNKINKKEFILFPKLNPSHLPAQNDGFVRAPNKDEALFKDVKGYNTGWRAINFIPYGIFTPYSGSVSGIYIQLSQKFMKDKKGNFDLDIYKKNLDLLEKAIQDRLGENDKNYMGLARNILVERGLFPLGTEFAHPLHYVDIEADATYSNNNKYPGLRSNRVKEIRYMYKYQMYYPQEIVTKEEDAALYYNEDESWIDNGAGWYMSGFIEDKNGDLRGQTPQELLSCIGCHSSTYGFEPEQFTSGTGNTIDTIWSMPRKLPEDRGWKEMDYLAYKYNKRSELASSSGNSFIQDPINKKANIGEFRYFLNHVVGASLYGDMPKLMEKFLKEKITIINGYSDNFPELKFDNVEVLRKAQEKRLKLIREFTKRKDYLTKDGYIQSSLIYPSFNNSLESIEGYRKIVATQRYKYGKDYFENTPFTFKYYRDKENSFNHISGKPYELGEIITDRPYDKSETILKGVGNVLTLIDEDGDNYDSEYLPLFKYPLIFEEKN